MYMQCHAMGVSVLKFIYITVVIYMYSAKHLANIGLYEFHACTYCASGQTMRGHYSLCVLVLVH